MLISHVLHANTTQKPTSLVEQGNYENRQSSGAQNIKHMLNLWKLALRSHLNTDTVERDTNRNSVTTKTTHQQLDHSSKS